MLRRVAYVRAYVPRVDVDDEEKSDEGRALGKVRFKRESAGATSARKKKGDRAEGEALREELPYAGDAVLEEYSAARASQRKRDEKERKRGEKVGEKSKWMGRR